MIGIFKEIPISNLILENLLAENALKMENLSEKDVNKATLL